MGKNSFIVIRHGYDDHSYIDGKNDTPLTSRGIEMATNAAHKVIYDVNSDKVIIRHSTKIRAKQTAEIICEYLLKNNIYCKIISDIGLTELFQGKFNFDGMEHTSKIDFLQSCWDDFEECRLSGDLSHHFGQNKSRDIVLSPGENHYEWSTRIARGLLNIIDDLEQTYQSINITHRGAIFELRNIIEMINGNILFDEIEYYNTVWMEYCQDSKLQINDLQKAKKLTKQYINQRSIL